MDRGRDAARAARPRYGFFCGLGAFVFGAAAIALVVQAFKWTGRAPCPSCATEMRSLPATGDDGVCGGCGRYAHCVDRTLAPTPDDHVATKPVYRFEIEPGEQPAFAALCADCGAPATRTVEQTLRKTGVVIRGVGRTSKSWRIAVPCCAAHGGDTRSYEGDLRVKSHRLWLLSTTRARPRIERPAA